MNRRTIATVCCLIFSGSFVAFGAFSQAPSTSQRSAIHLPGANPQLPFSDAVLAGNTMYLAGRIGLDPKTGQAPADVDTEIHLLLDGVKATLAAGGMTMDDLVYVQVSCTDLSLFDKFNATYRTYFTAKDLPAREFVGVATLLRGGHFELQSIAVRRAP
ncbi:MAG: Rid family hydrolase [Candidatus Acidiferrum sp.]|jgi:reactive intermediate/imine deaminase